MKKIVIYLLNLIVLSFLISGCALNKSQESSKQIWPDLSPTEESGQTTPARPELSEAEIIIQSGTNLEIILEHSGKAKKIEDQSYAMKTYTEPLTSGFTAPISEKYSINNYIVYGTRSVIKLSAKQRFNGVKKYLENVRALPNTTEAWKMVLNLTNELAQTEVRAEAQAKAGEEERCRLEAEDLVRGKINASANGVNIKINSPIELDFKSQNQIFELRRSYINQYSGLKPDGYEPSAAVFGQIQDGKPWWGITGTYCDGPGQNAINGESEESRFIANPYLLAGVIENGAYINPNPACAAVYPRAVSLFWHCSHRWAKAVYNVGAFQAGGENGAVPNANEVYLVAYNARDYGFNYLFFDSNGSSGLEASGFPGQPVALAQMLHAGPSCGYNGGCNNMSPNEPHMVLRVKSLPAVLKIKFWRQAPADAQANPDLLYVLEMK